MTLILVGHREPGVCSGWAWHAAMLLVLGQVRVRLARRHRTAHMYPVPLLRPGDKGDSSLGNSPGSRAINHRQWEQQRRSLDGVGARGIAQGRLDLWHPLAPLAMDAFDIGLKATALERKIKGWGKRKDHLFFFSFFFFFLNQQKERRNHGNATSSGRRRRPHTHHPALLARSSTRASCTHHPYCLTCWQEKPFPRTGSATALAPWSTAGGGRKGRQDEGDPLNKPRLNKLPGALRAQSRARCPH